MKPGRVLSCAVLAIVATGWASTPVEIVSPMVLEMPISDLLTNQEWTTTEARTHLCDNVALDSLVIRHRPIRLRTKEAAVQIWFEAQVSTRPAAARKATVDVEIRTDAERLTFCADNHVPSPTVSLDFVCKPGKTRKQVSRKFYVEPATFERLVGDPGARLVVTMTVSGP